MRFKLKGTEVTISFTFLALVLLTITVKNLNSLSLVLAFAPLHEAVHLLFICILSSPPKFFKLTLFGACIVRGEGVGRSCFREIIINASAPLFNLLAGLLFYCLGQLNWGRGEVYNNLYEINLVLGLFNLIPYYNFDGGNALFYLLSAFISQERVNKIITILSVIVAILFSSLSAYVFFQYKRNYALVIMSIYMLLSLVFKKQNTLDY